jgi:serine/threonine-protein kinase
MVTGQPPVQGTSFYSILKAHLETRPRPAMEVAPSLSPELSQVIAKSLEKNPAERFQNAVEFNLALNNLNFDGPRRSSASMISTRPPVPDAIPPAVPRSPSPPRVVTPIPPTPQTSSASTSWDPAVLESVRKNLAVFVGPMAKLLVNRAAKSAPTIQALYQSLATEISNPKDREKFLRTQPL